MAANIGTIEAVLRLRDEFSTAIQRASGQLQAAGKQMQATGRQMSAVGGTFTRSVTLPMAIAGGAALKMSSDFTTSLTKIETLVGRSREEVAGYRKEILRLSGETAKAPRELADAMFFITSAGLRGADALDALDAAAKASALGLGEAVSVADASTSAMNAYGPSVLSASQATNILALAVRAGKLEASELAPVMGRLLPTASSLGIRFEDVAGSLAVMSRTGLNAAEASTSLNSIMSLLAKGGTKQAQEVMEQAGLSMGALRDMAAKPGGLIDVMRLLDERTKQLSDEALAQVIPNIRAFRGVMNVLAQDSSVVDDVMGQVASGVDVLGEGMKRVAEDPGFKFNQFLTLGKQRLIELGDELVPAFLALLEHGTKLLEWVGKAVVAFTKLPEPLKTLVSVFAGVAFAIGPVLKIGGGLLQIFGSLTLALPKLGKALTAATGPWGAITLAIVAAVAAVQRVIDKLNEAHAAVINSVASTNDAMRAYAALKREMQLAARGQGELTLATIEAAQRAYPLLKRELEKQTAELEHQREIMTDWRGGVEKQETVVANLRRTLKDLEGALAATSDEHEALTAAVGAAAAALDEETGAAGHSIQLNAELAEKVANLRAQLALETAQAKELATAHRAGAKEFERVQKSHEALNIALSTGVTKQEAYALGLVDLVTEAMRAQGVVESLGEAQKKLTIDLTNLSENSFRDNTDAIKKNREAYDLLNRVAAAAGGSFREVTAIMRELRFAELDGILSKEQLARAMKLLGEETETTGVRFSDMSDAFADAVAKMILDAESIGDVLKAVFTGQAREQFTNFTRTLLDGIAEALDNVGQKGESVAAALARGWEAAKQKMLGVAAAIAAGFSASFGRTEDIAIGAMTAIVNYQEGNMPAAAIAGAGVILGVYKKLFGGSGRDSILEAIKSFGLELSQELVAAIRLAANHLDDAAAGLRRHLGEVIDEEGISNLRDLVKFTTLVNLVLVDLQKGLVTGAQAVHTMGDALNKVLDAFESVDGTIGSLNNIAKIFTDTIDRIALGFLTAEEAAELLNTSFEKFVEVAREMGDEGVEAIKRVVDAAREAGLESAGIADALRSIFDEALGVLEERNQLLVDEAGRILDGLEKLLSGAGRATKREIEFAATAVLQAFDAMRAAGVPLSVALEEISNAFDLIRARGAGIEFPPAFARLGEMLDILADKTLRNVIARLEAMGAAAAAAGNLGLLTADQFDTFGDRVRRTFKRLVEGGLTGREALAALAPQLQLLRDLAQQYGFDIDKNTQRLLDMADKQGLIADKGLTTEDILIKGFDRLLKALNALIEALGGVPIAFEEWEDSIDDAGDAGAIMMDAFGANATAVAQQVSEAWSMSAAEMTASIADFSARADGALGAVAHAASAVADSLARSFDGIPISFVVIDPDGKGKGKKYIHAQHGTGAFRDFGAGTPAMLHHTEQVITAREGTGIAQMVASAIGAGQSRRRGHDPQLAAIQGELRALSTALKRQQAVLAVTARDSALREM